MTDAPLPRKVHRIVWADGKPACVVAELVAINRSWWHVRHKDGSVTKHNGGSVSGPGSFMLRWYTHWTDAWIGEANRLLWLACFDFKDDKPIREARILLSETMAGAMDEAMEMGKLLGAIERKEPPP